MAQLAHSQVAWEEDLLMVIYTMLDCRRQQVL